MSNTIELDFDKKLKLLEQRFGGGMDVNATIFIVGIQELGWVPKRLSKDQKLDVMHVAICRLLEPFGYYEFTGKDADGWPHYDRKKSLPKLSASDQELLMKEALLLYFEEEGV